ncbi:MAG: c-type cytochrome [Bacteroidia bacterium]
MKRLRVNKLFNFHLAGIVFLIVIFSCQSDFNSKSVNLNSDTISTPSIENVIVNLPPAKGAALVQANCLTCHSLRYIELQPEMNRLVWDKIVKKMINHFGAPIADSMVAKHIVDYLMVIKGKK